MSTPHADAQLTAVDDIESGAGAYDTPLGITNPPIDELLDRASSKYALVIYAAKRARQINDYYNQLGDGILGAYGVEAILSSADIRGAITSVVLSANDPVAAWARLALDTPVMLHQDKGTFADWVRSSDPPTEADLAEHLTTLFPPVRPRGWFEVRYLDSQPIAWWPVPIVVLSSRGDEAGKVQALDLGADDYLTKPFGMDELLARMRAALRHQLQAQGERPIFRSGDLSVDLVRRIVKVGEREVKLSPKEYDLLRALVQHAGKVVTRTMLLENVWDYHFDPQTNVIDVHMSRLRSKIDRGFDTPLLQTIRGAGYMIRDSAR